MKSGITSLVLAGLLASAGFAASAQQTAPQSAAAQAPAMGASSDPAHHGTKGGHRRMDPAKREAMVAKRQAELKAKLKITAEQEGAWTSFTTAMKPPARMDHHKRPDRAEWDKLTTPERIDKMRVLRTQHMGERTVAMDQRADATKAFYAALNADQKKVFDAEFARMGRHHHGVHRGGADRP